MQRLSEWICLGCERPLTADETYICGDFHDGQPVALAPLCEPCIMAHIQSAHKPVVQEWLQ